MTTYALKNSQYTNGTDLQGTVGRQYHLGLSNGTQYYGYMLEPDQTKNGGFRQRSDTATKEALINYSSGQLIDRDLAYFPRITDGDFSGGGYQEVWIQTNKYFDSDLDPRVPGFLQLRSLWTRINKTGITPGNSPQVVIWNADAWFTFGETNGHIYSALGGTTTTPVAAAIRTLDTDGTYLYAGTSTTLYRSADGTSWTAVTSSINSTANRWWVVQQGTNGYFAYYRVDTGSPSLSTLYKIDLTTAFPIAAGAQPQVPTGGNVFHINDLVQYQTSIALLTNDIQGNGVDVWYHDGTNMTRIVRIDGYTAAGMCNCLGNLYVAANAQTQSTSPILAQVSSGSYTVVSKPGSPFITLSQTCAQPRSSGQYVYWPLIGPSINGISSANGVVLQYDTFSGATYHLPNEDSADFTTPSALGIHSIAIYGDSVVFVYVNGTTGVLQGQESALGATTYQPSGWLVSSHIDFATPGISKRFRRLEAHHAPLNAGEQITLEAFVDQDPLAFTTALTPVPSSATVTNTTVGSTTTAMTFGVDTIGKTIYFAIQLHAGTSNATTPRVSWVSIEVGGTWAWELYLSCSATRRTLTGEMDLQGVTGKDLAYLILLAYEQGQNLTLYHRNGQSYTVAIESCDAWHPSPQVAGVQEVIDEEYIMHCTLRQVA